MCGTSGGVVTRWGSSLLARQPIPLCLPPAAPETPCEGSVQSERLGWTCLDVSPRRTNAPSSGPSVTFSRHLLSSPEPLRRGVPLAPLGLSPSPHVGSPPLWVSRWLWNFMSVLLFLRGGPAPYHSVRVIFGGHPWQCSGSAPNSVLGSPMVLGASPGLAPVHRPVPFPPPPPFCALSLSFSEHALTPYRSSLLPSGFELTHFCSFRSRPAMLRSSS